MILIKNGSIVIDNKLVKKDILIDDSKIIEISDEINKKALVLDAKGCMIIPGAVDVHVHLREPGFSHKETIKSGTHAAAKGGITTIMAMPNLNPVPDSVDNLQQELDIIKRDAIINVYPYASTTIGEKGETLSDIDHLKDLVKAITDDGRGVNNIEVLKKAMIKAKEYNLVIASHAEDDKYGTSREGEIVAVKREIALAKEIGCKYHFCHLSCKESFDEIRKARCEGYTNITCEVAPHHLVLHEGLIKNANFKMNPPLRKVTDMEESVRALIDGTVDAIATDHAPHTKEEKSKEYDKCPNGIIGLETMIPIIYTNFVKTNLISLNRFIDLIVNNPSRIFNLPKKEIKVSRNADLAIIDINEEKEYIESEILSKSTNSPYIGNSYYGFIRYTILNGKVIYKK